MMQSSPLLKKIGASALLAALALLSVLWLVDLASSPERHAASLADLDEKKVTVMELTAATAATSVAVSAVPGDATTPIANQISELSSYLLLVVGAIMLEKVLLTLTGYLTFTYLIPAACILGAVSFFLPRVGLRQLALKLTLFGLAICLVIPVSLRVSNLVEETFAVQQTVDEAAQAADGIEEEAGAETEDGWLSQIGEAITGSVSALVQKAEDALSSFVDAIAALLIVNCVIPLLILWFFLWLVKAILGLHLEVPVRRLRQAVKGEKRAPALSQSGERDGDA